MTRFFSYLAVVLFCVASAVSAQEAPEPPSEAVLIADKVEVTVDQKLIARGNVEVFQGPTKLTAASITYDPDTDTLFFEGPLVMYDGPSTVVLADEAELDKDLRNGVLRSARMVLDRQLQLAAVQINRVDGRYSQLYKASVTACRVCNDDRPPLWQIRASRVVHDQEGRQLYFDNAQLRVLNVPVLYLPRLRLPDPTLERATGFLIPSLQSNSLLGTGVRIPYFIRLGDHKDLTLTPYLSPKTTTLEWRYRQAFRTGGINFNGAFSRDDLRTEDRYYVFGTGGFNLPRGYRLNFDVELTSDESYLSNYTIPHKDRLDSSVNVFRARKDEFVSAGLIGYRSLRAGELDQTLPTVVAQGRYERRFFPGGLGGELRMGFDAQSHYRSSKNPVNGEGRDVSRINAKVDWLNSWTLLGGLRAEARLGLAFDLFDTRQDDTFAGQDVQTFAQGAYTLRYPLSRVARDGSLQFIEPIVQLGWTGVKRANVANEESTRVEFDEGNLLALSRFPEADRRERDTVLALGLNWARYDPAGWESHLSLGQIVRNDAIADFSRGSGLQGTDSDVLVAAQIKTQTGLSLAGRALLDDDFDFTKAELRGDWSAQGLTLGGSYLWLIADPDEDRSTNISELTVDGSYAFQRHWRVSGNWRYDIFDDRTASAGVGLSYNNECVSVDLAVNRAFSESANVEPTTTFGLTIALRGFSATNGRERYTRSCASPAS